MDDGYYDAWMENSMAKTLKQSHQDTHPQPVTTCSGCGESSTKDGFLATYCLKCCEMASGKREWVGLTDEEMKATWYEMLHIMGWYTFEEIANAVTAKLKEKNT